MRRITSFGLTIFIVFFLIYCTKNSASSGDINTTILGKWENLSDSAFIGVGMNNRQETYIGQTGDYFDLRRDGFVYTKEGAVLDTLSYSLTSDTTIVIAYFGITLNGVPETSHITNLTAHDATISAPVAVTPGGEFGRKVILKR